MPKDLLWALCTSLALHLSLLGIQTFTAHHTSGRGQGTAPAPITATLLGTAKNLPIEPNATTIERNSPHAINTEDSREPTGTHHSPESRDSPATNKNWGGLLPYLETYQDKPIYLTIPEGLSYFRRSELTVAPVMLDGPLINGHEALAKDEKIFGHVTLRLFISASGEIEQTKIISSNLSPADEKTVVAAFKPVKFRPGEIEGVAVSSQVLFEIDFEDPAKGFSRSTEGTRLHSNPSRPVPEGRVNNTVRQPEKQKAQP